jgi:serine/threonine protein kinase
MSPTLSLEMTQAGMILGTVAYMSPEQARGKAVDRRADIWAFGVVLYEMLTGKTLFASGGTLPDMIAAVMTREPDWSVLPKDTPAHVRRLLRRCFCKDAKNRLRDIGDARIALDEGGDATPEGRMVKEFDLYETKDDGGRGRGGPDGSVTSRYIREKSSRNVGLVPSKSAWRYLVFQRDRVF